MHTALGPLLDQPLRQRPQSELHDRLVVLHHNSHDATLNKARAKLD